MLSAMSLMRPRRTGSLAQAGTWSRTRIDLWNAGSSGLVMTHGRRPCLGGLGLRLFVPAVDDRRRGPPETLTHGVGRVESCEEHREQAEGS